MDVDDLVILEGVRFSHGPRRILDGIDIRIRRGSVTTIMGPSGTGKTTLLRLIGGQLRPQAGRVVVDGEDVPNLPRRRLFELRKRMGMMFQSGALFNDLNVFENVAFPLREHTTLPESMIRARGARTHALGAVRVALARAIALDPMMIMYDEPFTGQDPITVGVIMQLIRRLNDALGLTSVIVSHDVAEVSAISDHLYVISEGKVLDHGTPEALGRSPSAWVQQFLHGRPDGPIPFHYPAPDYAEDLLGADAA